MALTRLHDSVIVEVNEEWCQLTGFPRQQVLGFSALELGIWASDADRELALRPLQGSGRVRDADVVMAREDGLQRMMCMNAVLVEVQAHAILTTRDLGRVGPSLEDRRHCRRVARLTRPRRELDARADRELEVFGHARVNGDAALRGERRRQQRGAREGDPYRPSHRRPLTEWTTFASALWWEYRMEEQQSGQPDVAQ